MDNQIYMGKNCLLANNKETQGGFVDIEGEKFYKISNYDGMPDFFMTIVSNSNHWMYLSSNGSLTAGRKNRNNSLFPYYTVDKIHDYKGKTGSKTICLVEKKGQTFLWEPFSDEAGKAYRIECNLYKSIYGNKVVFEERNLDLELSFQYGWYNSEKFGWIKKSGIQNFGKQDLNVKVLDGICNILPYGVEYAFQNEYSNLSDAYKKNELIEESKLGLFMLSSIPVDKAEPSEALKATTVWSLSSAKGSKYLVSENQLNAFRYGKEIDTELDVKAKRGAYYLHASYRLKNSEKQQWYFAAEVNQDTSDVANLNKFLCETENIEQQIEDDINKGTKQLVKIVANADGLQIGKEELSFARHFSNTLYNIMRGGIYAQNYNIDTNDFKQFVAQTNLNIQQKFQTELEELPHQINYNDLLNWAKQQFNTDLERICFEYLPLTFSRRHGDPSRPWNQFSIETKNEDGSDKLNYQGNWRDIFQNWEALNLSFPGYIEGIIGKFLNASTADGYNPYRITREGIDWESPEPDDPWAYIGYWGDHQIIYLQKFLEQSEQYVPGKLDELLSKDIFVYANVPYRIKPFEELVKNPKDTIEFDFELNSELEKQTQDIGADGKLLRNQNGQIVKANLLEKMLATLLSKLSNFIPGAGIWMNTQRPEWNDANNALVGNGVSMVTLYYLRRFIAFWDKKFEQLNDREINISAETKDLFDSVYSIFNDHINLVDAGFDDVMRYQFTEKLGIAGANYRQNIYANSFSGRKSIVKIQQLKEFTDVALKYVNQSIQKNKREDGLYHAYNLVALRPKSISIRFLYEMLEGQVAVLSSGGLSANESLNVLDALKASALFRADQYSYILYPNRELPRFIQKNNIPADRVKASVLAQKLLQQNNTSILRKDNNGNFHFNGKFRNANELSKALHQLQPETYGKLVELDKQYLLDVYEDIFDHQSFTGRSGTFYGYEGLGSIYWHMVSKLLLATQECYFKAINEDASAEVIGRLRAHYYEIKAGIGLYKSPGLYGAFPTDAYSHTPWGAGAKQPGLTGQVKEDVISRFGELGVLIKNGELTFSPSLLNPDEILKKENEFTYFDLTGEQQTLKLYENQLAFTLCQVPVVYTFGNGDAVKLILAHGSTQNIDGKSIDQNYSSKIFARSGEVVRIEVTSSFIKH